MYICGKHTLAGSIVHLYLLDIHNSQSSALTCRFREMWQKLANQFGVCIMERILLKSALHILLTVILIANVANKLLIYK